MKQHITPKQAKEISEDHFYKLFNNQHWGIVRRKDWADYHHKKVTIGKMIEVLEEKSRCTQQIVNDGGRYSISINEKGGNVTGWQTEYYNELCDALWDAVKSMLSNYNM